MVAAAYYFVPSAGSELSPLAAILFIGPQFILGIIGFVLSLISLVNFKKGFVYIALIGLLTSICSMPLVNITIARFAVAPIISPIVDPIVTRINNAKGQAQWDKAEQLWQDTYSKVSQDLVLPEKVIGINNNIWIMLSDGYVVTPSMNDLPSINTLDGSAKFGTWAQSNLVGQTIQVKLPPYSFPIGAFLTCDKIGGGSTAVTREMFGYPDTITGVCDPITVSIYLNGNLVNDNYIVNGPTK